MKRLLITGANGFVGRHCLSLLPEHDIEVHAMTRSGVSSDIARVDVQWHTADLLTSGEIEGVIDRVRPTHCLHLAWITEPGRYWHAEANLQWVAASLRLMSAFADAGGQRMVVAGSCAEYMDERTDCDERAMDLKPHTMYGRSKHALHLMLASLAEQREIELAWGRLFYLYGPAQEPTRLVPSVVRTLLAGETFKSRSPRQVCDYIHVRDAASAFLQLAQADAVGGFNIATGIGHSVGEVVSELAALCDHRKLVDDPCPQETTSPEPAFVGQPERLRTQLGWRPQYDLAAGLRETFEQMTRGQLMQTQEAQI